MIGAPLTVHMDAAAAAQALRNAAEAWGSPALPLSPSPRPAGRSARGQVSTHTPAASTPRQMPAALRVLPPLVFATV